MLENNRVNKYGQPYSGPFCITQVNMNGTVRLKINTGTDTGNIRHIHQKPTILAGACMTFFYELLELAPCPPNTAVMTDLSCKVLTANQVG
jgi:hypothetical protein